MNLEKLSVAAAPRVKRSAWSLRRTACAFGLLLMPMPLFQAGQSTPAGAPAPTHTIVTANCCGFTLAVDETNLTSIAECAATDSACAQGISLCFADGSCKDLPAGNAGASVRYWKKYAYAGAPQRLDVVVGNISAHAPPTPAGWTRTQGAPLP